MSNLLKISEIMIKDNSVGENKDEKNQNAISTTLDQNTHKRGASEECNKDNTFVEEIEPPKQKKCVERNTYEEVKEKYKTNIQRELISNHTNLFQPIEERELRFKKLYCKADISNQIYKYALIQITYIKATNKIILIEESGMIGEIRKIQETCDLEKEAAYNMFEEICKKYESEKYSFVEISLMNYNSLDEFQAKIKPLEFYNLSKEVNKLFQNLIFDEELAYFNKIAEAIISFSQYGYFDKDQLLKGIEILNQISLALHHKQPIEELNNIYYASIPRSKSFFRLINEIKQVNFEKGCLQYLLKSRFRQSKISRPKFYQFWKYEKKIKRIKGRYNLVNVLSDEFNIIRNYITNTADDKQLTLLELFKVKTGYHNIETIGNQFLLFHGRPMEHIVKVLKNGIELPKLDSKSNYPFGKGIYFANVSTYALNHCDPIFPCNYRYLFLCRVSLGRIQERRDANFEDNRRLHNNYNSIYSQGFRHPSKRDIVIFDNMKIFQGKLKNSKEKKKKFPYPQFVIFDQNQVSVEYIAKIQLN